MTPANGQIRRERLPIALAAPLERAAAAVARLDSRLAGHPLASAWAYRAQLDAIRRQAAVDGQLIDPWQLAALIEGVRFRLDSPAMIDRGAVFAAARHAFDLHQWFARPDAAQRAAIAEAAAHLDAFGNGWSPLIAAAIGAHAWLDKGGERPPIRAALAGYWLQRRVTSLPCPLLSGAAALHAEVPWARELWIEHFLDALADEAEDGITLLACLERHWFAARRAVAGRRRDSRAGAAIDILAAAPLVSATSLGQALGMATKNATRLLEGFVVLGIASEVTHRSKRRLYGLKHLTPLREIAAPPRRPLPGRRPGRPSTASLAGQDHENASLDEHGLGRPPCPPLPPLERREYEFGELDRWLDLADQAIRRAQRLVQKHSGTAMPGAADDPVRVSVTGTGSG
jgi:hypothetical protein